MRELYLEEEEARDRHHRRKGIWHPGL